MEQTQYNLLFRWFIGLSMDDAVWVPSVFSKNHERLIEHDAVIELFNLVLEQAQTQDLLSGEHFSVDGTLIQAWAGQKALCARMAAMTTRTAATFETKAEATTRTSPAPMPTRACSTARGDNAMVTTADGHAEREAAKAMINDARQAANNPQAEITLGADKGYDAKEFIDACIEMSVVPHVAQNTTRRRSAVPDAIAATRGYAISIQKRKLIEQGFGWAKTVGGMRQVMVRGIDKVDQMFVLTMAAFMELIVLNVGYSLGFVPQNVFTMLVLMAIGTTVLTGPVLHVLLNLGGLRVIRLREA